MRIYSFAPIVTKDSKAIILGSIPGIASLKAWEYYAYPRNQFWTILKKLTDGSIDCYQHKLNIIIRNELALWDVIKSCYRETSSDSKIVDATVNNFTWLFKSYPKIKYVYFNGAKAEQEFKKNVDKKYYITKSLVRLPSTSPAHTQKIELKLAQWRQILNY